MVYGRGVRKSCLDGLRTKLRILCLTVARFGVLVWRWVALWNDFDFSVFSSLCSVVTLVWVVFCCPSLIRPSLLSRLCGFRIRLNGSMLVAITAIVLTTVLCLTWMNRRMFDSLLMTMLLFRL